MPPSDRPHVAWWDSGTLWFSVNACVGTFGVGYLGQAYHGMGLRDAALTIVFFNLLSCVPVAYMSIFGKALGLRQMVLSRFSLGYYGGKIPAVFNLIACTGWSTMNAIAGVSCLRAVSENHKIPVAAAVVLLGKVELGVPAVGVARPPPQRRLTAALLTLIASFCGYKFIHAYERYSGIPVIMYAPALPN